MEIRCVLGLCLLAVTVFPTISCAPKAASIDRFRIHKQLHGWVEEKESYCPFDAKGLFKLIDGGAPEYIDIGMKNGFFQRLKRPDSATIELYAEDFGSEGNARKMSSVKQSNTADTPSTIMIDSSIVIIQEVIGGFWTCAAINHYYFELTLMGITDTTKAKTEIGKFFNHFRKTIGIQRK